MKFATETQHGLSPSQSRFTQRREGAKPPGTLTFQPLRLCLLASLREESCQNTRFCVPGSQRANSFCRAVRVALVGFMISALAASISVAQNPAPSTETLKKANTRPADPKPAQTDPFDGASVEKMTGQCVTLDTESGLIVIEMLPKAAPETARSFLNLAASGALDTTTFSRVVRDFVIQGGNLSTSEKWNIDLAKRMAHHLPDEPSAVRHERGIVRPPTFSFLWVMVRISMVSSARLGASCAGSKSPWQSITPRWKARRRWLRCASNWRPWRLVRSRLKS